MKQFFFKIGVNIPFNAKIWLPSGCKIDVHFRESDQSLTHLGPLIKEYIQCCGFILVVSYREGGNFMIYILNKQGVEIDCVIPREHCMDNIGKQGILGILYYLSYIL